MTRTGDECNETVLVVEDDRSLREALALNLKARGYRVLAAADGDEGVRAAFDARPDLVLLDLVLPGWNGLEILAELRRRGVDVPVLILSARGRLDDKVRGLELGADDYVTKPFELPELLARVEAALRRRRGARATERLLGFGEVAIDVTSREVRVRGLPVDLSAREFDLLCLLVRSPGQVFPREVILDRVWGWGFEGTERTVDNFVLSLRQKIESDPSNPRHLRTVRQVGYKLDP